MRNLVIPMFPNRTNFPLPTSPSLRAPLPPPQGPMPLNRFNNFLTQPNKPISLNAGFFENNTGMSSNWRPPPPPLQGAPLNIPNIPGALNNFFQIPSTISNNDDEEVCF